MTIFKKKVSDFVWLKIRNLFIFIFLFNNTIWILKKNSEQFFNPLKQKLSGWGLCAEFNLSDSKVIKFCYFS